MSFSKVFLTFQLLLSLIMFIDCNARTKDTFSPAQWELYHKVGRFLRNWSEKNNWLSSKPAGRALNNENKTRPNNPSTENWGWLPNSNKIGLSYDPFMGDPVCFTGTCQMTGFKLPLFKLEFTQPAIGSCVKQMIPKNVEVKQIQSRLTTY